MFVPMLWMARVVSSSRRIRTLFKTTTYLHDLQPTVLLAPLLDQINCVGKPKSLRVKQRTRGPSRRTINR